MIKNPIHLQKVYFLEEDQIKSGKINYLFQNNVSKKNLKGVEISHYYFRRNSEIYPTKQSAQNALPKEISKTLKILNKRIKELSKKREKLASKLARLLKKGR